MCCNYSKAIVLFLAAQSWNKKSKRTIDYVNSDNEDADDPEAVEEESNLLSSYKSESKKSRLENQVEVPRTLMSKEKGDCELQKSRENVFFVSKYFSRKDESESEASPQNSDHRNPDHRNPDHRNPDHRNPDHRNPHLQKPDHRNPDLLAQKQKRKSNDEEESPPVKSKTTKEKKRQSKAFLSKFIFLCSCD
jgi:hypothetical protein